MLAHSIWNGLFLGPDEDTPRPMECLEFVSRAPTNLFKLRTSYPPYKRTKPDLTSLLSVAQEILKQDTNEPVADESTTAKEST